MTEETTLAVMDGAATEPWVRTLPPATVAYDYNGQQLIRLLVTDAWNRLRVSRATQVQRGGG